MATAIQSCSLHTTNGTGVASGSEGWWTTSACEDRGILDGSDFA